MNSTLIYALTANGKSFAENATQAGTVTLVGMVAIFAVLALLWGLIEIMHLILAPTAKSEKPAPAPKPPKAPKEPKAPKAPKAVAAAPAVQAPAQNGGELIAVITAAVAAAMAEEGYTGGFRVVSFKRAPIRRSGRH